MSVLKSLFAVCMFFLLQGSGCSTNVEKLEFGYKDDFSGFAKAKIDVGKIENGKRIVTTEELDELYKVSNVCDVTLREIYGYEKKFIADYKFNSYEELIKALECSKATQEHVTIHPLDIKDGFLTKDVTIKMAFFESSGAFSFNASTLPDELIITMPGDITNVSFDYLHLGLFTRFIINENTSKSTFDILGNNKVVFKLQELRAKTKRMEEEGKLLEVEGIDYLKKTDLEKIETRCGSDSESEEVKRCKERELNNMIKDVKTRQISKWFFQENMPGFGFSITTRINKISKLFK